MTNDFSCYVSTGLLNCSNRLEVKLMQIELDEVKHIATLAKVRLTDSDMKQMQAQLSDILDQFAVLNEVDTKSAEAFMQSENAQSPIREDMMVESKDTDVLLSNVPLLENDLVRVKSVLKSKTSK